jgi:hypothetical protein
VDSEAQPIGGGPDPCLIPDLRSIPLGQLAKRAAVTEDIVADVVLRIVEGMESPSRVQVMMFNSAI